MRSFYYLSLIFIFSLSLSACQSSSEENLNQEAVDSVSTNEETTTEETSSTDDATSGDYLAIDMDMAIGNYIGEQVMIKGKIAATPMQHLMKPEDPFGQEEEKHTFISYNNGEEIVGYYKAAVTVPNDDAAHTFYGTVDKVSGAGKGGGMHTEYYLNLEKVD